MRSVCCLEASEIDVLDAALAHDLVRRFFRDDAETCLRARERGFDLEIIAGPRFVGKHLAHLSRAEDVAKDRGIERRRRHVFSPVTWARAGARRRNGCAVPRIGQSTMLGLRRFWSQSIRLTWRTWISQRSAVCVKR